MLSLIGFLLVGITIGFFIQKRRLNRIFMLLSPVMNFTIGGLLFFLGITIGKNKQIMDNIAHFGIDALYISLGAVIGSVLFAWLNYRLFFAKGKINLSPSKMQMESSSSRLRHSKKRGWYVWSIELFSPILFFGAGIFIGYFFPQNGSSFFYKEDDILLYLLHFLMFLVGIFISQQNKSFQAFCSHKYVLMLVPLGTIVGTLLGSGFVSLFMKEYTLSECMAVGSGMGYYSLSSVLISEYASVELGTIALLANIIREVIALFFAGVLAKTLGDLAPIAAGGATSADVTLPVISHHVRQEFAVISIIHGITTDISVPFLVTFFLCF